MEIHPKPYILVQPWFSAQGHPAQSLLNLSRIVPPGRISLILVSAFDSNSPFAEIADKISHLLPLRSFGPGMRGNNLRRNTLLAGLTLLALFFKGKISRNNRLFFVDGDIYAFCALACLGVFIVFPSPILIILHGPGLVSRHPLVGRLVGKILRWTRSKIFLRSPTHLTQWQQFQKGAAFYLLPPVEGAFNNFISHCDVLPEGPIRVGVIGQIREGKSIPQLLVLSDVAPDDLAVVVCGPLSERPMSELSAYIHGRSDVRIGFMSEMQMLRLAGEQDYLSCLFENDWDIHSESATFWLAIKVLKPVLSFDEGWVADMIRQTGCGVIIKRSDFQMLADIIPKRDTIEYRRLLKIIQNYRDSLCPKAIWASIEASVSE
jgi:hypothetical protein